MWLDEPNPSLKSYWSDENEPFFKKITSKKMTRKLILMLAIALTMFAVDAKAECPEGFYGPYTSSFVTCAGCSVTVIFCTRPNEDWQTQDIFIDEISYVESTSGDCLCLASVPPGAYRGPAVEDVTLGILNNNESIFGSMADLLECASVTQQLIRRMRVFTGGCYHYTPPGYPDNRAKYTICNPYLLGECRQYYKICKEWVNDNHWERRVEAGPATATFTCDNPLYGGECVPLCR